jgi:hypothetical protein
MIAAVMLASASACSIPETPGCMGKNELGTIVKIDQHETPGRYGPIKTATVRFHMIRYLPTRGRIRICEASSDDALAMLKLGDTINPRQMTDVTP